MFDFRVLDLTRDQLPPAQVVFIRQVLQLLSNEQIMRALPQLAAKFEFLILTEHLPLSPSFDLNADKPSGVVTMLSLKSGVVLTSAPFSH